MSIQKRKISYWAIDFLSGDKHYFDPEIFKRFMTYINTLDQQSRLQREEKLNKAIALENVYEKKTQRLQLYEVTFKSCKYNHSPDYMSSVDGTERPTQKLLYEGDKELTHICFRIDDNEVYTIFEERRNGVSMRAMVTYLNRHLKKFIEKENMKNDFYLSSSIIPPDDFITALGKTRRISETELFVERKILGSEYLNLMDDDINSRNDLTIIVKSKPRKSLAKRIIEDSFTKLTTGGTEVSRIRVRAKDENSMNVIIDSLNGKKVDEINVELQENGIVDSKCLFSKMEDIMGE